MGKYFSTIAYLLLMRGEINKIAQCVMQLGVGTVDRRVSIYPLELDMSPHHFWQRLGKEKKCTIKWSWEWLDWNPMSYQIYIYILGYVCTAYYTR